MGDRRRQGIETIIKLPSPESSYLADFVAAYDFARKLKTLEGLTPHELI